MSFWCFSSSPNSPVSLPPSPLISILFIGVLSPSPETVSANPLLMSVSFGLCVSAKLAVCLPLYHLIFRTVPRAHTQRVSHTHLNTLPHTLTPSHPQFHKHTCTRRGTDSLVPYPSHSHCHCLSHTCSGCWLPQQTEPGSSASTPWPGAGIRGFSATLHPLHQHHRVALGPAQPPETTLSLHRVEVREQGSGRYLLSYRDTIGRSGRPLPTGPCHLHDQHPAQSLG